MPKNQAITQKFTWSGLLSGLCGLACVGLGLVVIAGWHQGNAGLVRIREGFVPMQYSSALCFILSGLGLISFVLRLPRLVPALCGGLVAGFAGLLSLEYLSGWNLGVGYLRYLVPSIPELTAGNSPAPTAAGFTFAGAGILLLRASLADSPKRLLIWILGSCTVALGLMALCAFRLGVRMMFVSGDSIGMAAHSAGGLIVLGIGLLAAQWARPHRFLDDRWLPVPIMLGTLVASLMLWQALTANRTWAVREQADVIAQNVASDALNRFTFCLRSLNRIKLRWENSELSPYPEWYSDARDCLTDEAVYEAVGRTDAEGKVSFVEQDSGAEP